MNDTFLKRESLAPPNQSLFKKIIKKLILSYLNFYDLITFLKKRKSPVPIGNPKKILISNIVFLGDVVITTSILPIIKKHYPNAKLFFLASSNTQPLIKHHPLIEKVFCFDHIKVNRKKINFIKKIFFHFYTKNLALRQIKKEKITLAIDFHFISPSVRLLHKAKIPNILGYKNPGYKNFTTIQLEKPFNPFWHMSQYHINLLNILLIKKEEISPLLPNLPYSKPKNNELKNYEKNFILFHPGAGQKKRFLNIKKAQQILDILPKDAFVLFVGLGIDEQKHIEKIIKDRTNCINLSNILHILDIVYLCKKAKMLISTDSAVAHIASSFDYPQIIYFKTDNIIHQNLWCLNKPNIKICQFIN